MSASLLLKTTYGNFTLMSHLREKNAAATPIPFAKPFILLNEAKQSYGLLKSLKWPLISFSIFWFLLVFE